MSEYISVPTFGHRPIQIDEAGAGRYLLGVQARLRAGNVLYHKGNFFPGTTNSWYQMRSTASRTFELPHAEAGIYDQTIMLWHTHQAAGVSVGIDAILRLTADVLDPATGVQSLKDGPILWQGTLPYDCRFFFAPERGSAVIETSAQKVIEVPELRLPHSRFRLRLTPSSAPDAGELQMRIAHRQ